MTWLVYNTATGAPIGPLRATEPTPQTGEAVVVVPASAMFTPPLAHWDAAARGFVDGPPDADLAAHRLLAQRRIETAAALPWGLAELLLHGELRDLDALGGAALAALAPAERRRRFPLLIAEADLTGDGLAVVATRVATDIAPVVERVARRAARLHIARRAIAAAADRAAIEAAEPAEWDL